VFAAHASRLIDSAAHRLMGDGSVKGGKKKRERGERENGRNQREKGEGGKSGFSLLDQRALPTDRKPARVPYRI